MKRLHVSAMGWLKDHHKLLLAIGIPLVIAIGGVVASVVVWDGYRANYLNQRGAAHVRLDQALSLPTSNSDERRKKLDALSGSAQNLHDYRCDSIRLLGWETQIIPSYKAWTDECNMIDHKLEALAGALDNFVGYMKNDQELAAILKPLLDLPKDVTDKDFSSRYEAWQRGARQVSAIKEASDFTPVKKVADAAVNEVVRGWKSIVDANNTKDDNSYEAARGTLIKAYSSLGAVKDESDKEAAGTIKAVEGLYVSTF